MTLRPILMWPDARLTQLCQPVADVTDAVRALVKDMLETMYHAKGRGLAASQVGVLSRVFVMDATWKEGAPNPMAFINPEILGFGDETAEADEGCLSIPGVSVRVTRPVTALIAWTDLDGARHEEELTGFAATCAQHEVDHLDGLVTLDRVDDGQRAEILAEYEAR